MYDLSPKEQEQFQCSLLDSKTFLKPVLAVIRSTPARLSNDETAYMAAINFAAAKHLVERYLNCCAGPKSTTFEKRVAVLLRRGLVAATVEALSEVVRIEFMSPSGSASLRPPKALPSNASRPRRPPISVSDLVSISLDLLAGFAEISLARELLLEHANLLLDLVLHSARVWSPSSSAAASDSKAESTWLRAVPDRDLDGAVSVLRLLLSDLPTAHASFGSHDAESRTSAATNASAESDGSKAVAAYLKRYPRLPDFLRYVIVLLGAAGRDALQGSQASVQR